VVLAGAGAFVYWRVEFALNRQLDQDLDAYHAVITRDLVTGDSPPEDTPGQSYQLYDRQGRVVGGDARGRLVDVGTAARAPTSGTARRDHGRLLPASAHPYRVLVSRVTTPRGPVVAAAAISRSKHDEALRELLLQLVIADLATLVAASLVGYGVARGALRPVERYRIAAERADGASTLPVEPGRDDEVTRLGHTFNALLARISGANARERQFLADTSHELRSPLAVMRAELEMALLRPRPAAETTAALESLRSQVERLIALSDALLELEEVRAGDLLDGEEIDATALVCMLAERYARKAADQGRRIDTVPSGSGDHRSRADAVLLQGNRHWLDVALRNLVSNALRYGEGTITISTTEAGDRVRLTVSDEGPGFTQEFVGRAFDRFTRAEASRTSPGTGLGLSLVQAVAEAHGGSAAITGSSVTLDLPSRPPLG
jgi:signal transduction histidine kinase